MQHIEAIENLRSPPNITWRVKFRKIARACVKNRDV
jgi:hypothetical protein